MSEPEQPRTPPTGADATPELPETSAGEAGQAGGVQAGPPPQPGHEPTRPVTVPPAESATAGTGARLPVPGSARAPVVRRRPGSLTVMGPWAPVAGALLGAIAAIVAVLLLHGTARLFGQRLSLVLLVVGLSMLGAAGPLLADEVRMLRSSARESAVRPALSEATRGLLSGLTPARLLLLVSAFVLFLSAYLGRG